MRGGPERRRPRGNEPPRFWARRRSGDAGLGLLSGPERGSSPAAVRRRSDGWAPHARQGRSSSGEPLTLGSTACITEGPLMPKSFHRPPLSRACRPAPGAARGQGGPRRPPALTSTGLPSPTSPRWRVPSTGLGVPSAGRYAWVPPLHEAYLDDVPFVMYAAMYSAFALLLLSHSGGRGAYSRGAASLLFDWSRRPDRRRRRPAGRAADGPARRRGSCL
jgi:hypothetical protein